MKKTVTHFDKLYIEYDFYEHIYIRHVLYYASALYISTKKYMKIKHYLCLAILCVIVFLLMILSP